MLNSITQSSFENMSKNQQSWLSKLPKSMPPFIRNGKVGDWNNYLFSLTTDKDFKK
ncbi:MAG: sulfotransferase domain-containing protein [cyanobacterium endosymbiont of Rhopalodia musculus]|uniref:sulfotransferase domain-containing protein n=1 Tax=cyanobacterium endosymbiont of Epithemia clementina EcSB TaxID=3034674 RepID=UPI00386C3CC1